MKKPHWKWNRKGKLSSFQKTGCKDKPKVAKITHDRGPPQPQDWKLNEEPTNKTQNIDYININKNAINNNYLI